MSGLVGKHLLIRGRVQGVGYRANAQQAARQRALRGWVRNRRDGRVEAEVWGAADQVEEFIAWCRSGPRFAQVDDVTVTTLNGDDAPASDAFTIRH